MRKLIYLLLFGTIILACKQGSSAIEEQFECAHGLMRRAWYEHGADEPIPDLKGLPQNFMILVDTSLRPTNFVSYDESYLLEESTSLDTSDMHWVEDWDNLKTSEKLKRVAEERNKSKTKADSIHQGNNQRQQQVWIINNSDDTVGIQMQDWLFICILQAKARNGQWHPVQYWRLSTCGNSYYTKTFLPKTANSFIADRHLEGDYPTTLRYKLMGAKTFYYSNEFDGRINYCEFVEDSTSYNEEDSRHTSDLTAY